MIEAILTRLACPSSILGTQLKAAQPYSLEVAGGSIVRWNEIMKFAAAVILFSLASYAQGNHSADDIVWLDNYQTALKQSRATGKPIFLEYRCVP